MRILIIEDEFKLADAVANRLRKEHYNVDISLDGENGLDNALSDIYDLIILDVMLPKVNGFEILKQIKSENISSKVIMLTAKAELNDKLNCFFDGADDYITKPFHIEELIARVNIQLRRTDGSIDVDLLEFGDLVLNVRTTKLICKRTNKSIDIICKEFLIIEYLMRNHDQVISKDSLYDKIWGYDNVLESNNLEAYISFIRKKLKVIGSVVVIKAIRGLGYRLEVQDEEIKK